MSQRYLLLICILAVLVLQGHAAKILGVFPIPARSHNNINLSLMRELASRGHQVTVVGFFPQNPPMPNYTDIVLENPIDKILGNQNYFEEQVTCPIKRILFVMDIAGLFAEKALEQPKMQNLIHAKDLHFDLIIIPMFCIEALLGFAHKFKAPVVEVCPFVGSPWMGDVVGNPNPYAYIPDVFTNYNSHMSFLERLYNTIYGTFGRLANRFYHIPNQDILMKKYFNYSQSLPNIAELERYVSLLLINQDVSLSYAKPLVPNMVHIGGIHITPPKKLPQDIQNYMDTATDGVIYFSMGSFLKSANMPKTMQQAIFETFSKLKQRVLWKWESDDLPGTSHNVRVGKWFPQSDILGHPNLRLFITHGGLLSTQEATYHGVPVIGLPVFGDQDLNMATVESSGYGLKINLNNVTVESLQWAINHILKTPSYHDNAKRLSRLFRDQPQTPMQRAIYWTEYVLRHDGAHHLKSAGLDLSWYQYHLLDVIAVLLLGAITLLLAVYLVLRSIVRMCCKTGRKEQKPQKNKKKMH